MKKLFTFVMALVAAVSLNAATQVVFDFSDATAYGYANPEAGKYTQVENGAVLTKEDVKISIAFEEGKNGFRFFANTNTGAINLRAYVGASFTIAAPEGKKLAAIAADGQNLTTQYLADGMTSKNWTSDEGVASLTTNVIKSTVQFNSLTITIIDEGEEPPTQETVKVDVAGAIAAGMALETGKTSSEVYEVTGFVVNAEPFSAQHNNQIWWMADDAENTGAQEFEAYACTVSEDKVLMQVLNGDKVTLTGNITKYNDTKNEKIIIEIKNGTAVFISKAEGDHSISGDTPPAQDLDTITVASALEIGAKLGSGESSEAQYVVKGYVSDIISQYDATNKNETFWMADTEDSRAASNAEGAFEVYRGKIVQEEEVGLHAFVYVTCKIQNFKGTTIETANNPIPSVNIAKKGQEEKIDTIDVKKALEIGNALTAGAVSPDRYAIEGYVCGILERYSSYGNETFYIADKKGERTNDKTVTFEVYRGKPDSQKEIGLDGKVRVVCKIKNYNGTIENDGTNIPVEVLEQGELKIDTISVAEAVEKTKALPEGSQSFDFYAVKGYIAQISTPYDEQYGNMSFYISDDQFASKSNFQCYRAKPAKEDAARAVKGAFVIVTGHLDNNQHGLQMYTGAEVFVGDAPQLDTLTVAKALEIGKALDEGASTDYYGIRGFVASIIADYEDELQSFVMSDDKEATSGEFRAIDALIDDPGAKLHDDVLLIGKIEKVNGVIRVVKGHATVNPGTGIQNVTVSEKAQKIMIDGVLYIIRDNKIFNVQGTQVR